MVKKFYDDSNWREEYKQYTSNKRYLELLENVPKQLSQAWVLGALYNEWKKIKGYNKLDPKENEGQLQSSFKEFNKKYGQDSVLIQTKKTGTLSATRKGGLGKSKNVKLGKFKPQGKNPEGQSQIKGKTFTYG